MKRKNAIQILMICIAIVGIFAVDNYYNFGLSARIVGVLKPVGIVFENIGSKITGSIGSIGNIGNLQKENRELKDKLNASLAQIAILSSAQQENDSLKRDLGFKKQSDFKLVAASIVSYDPSNIRETITINIGKSDGLTSGDIVVSEGFLVGVITDIADHTSKIRLITDPLSAVPANIMDSSITGIVKGTIGAGLTMEQVPQSEKVDSGSYVLTSGLGGEYPKGIIIGKVEEVQKISGSIFQMITVKSMVDLSRLERVMVIVK